MNPLKLIPPTIGLLLAVLQPGCAKYDYELLDPPALTERVGPKQAVGVRVDPLQYDLRAVDSRLVMLVNNPTDAAITLVGGESYAVTPDGRSHPMPTQTIAPGSYVKLIFPPLRPQMTATGPSFSVGMGSGYGAGWGYYGSTPERYVYNDGEVVFWDWDGETDVRMLLKYDDGAEGFEHPFVFGRRKR